MGGVDIQVVLERRESNGKVAGSGTRPQRAVATDQELFLACVACSARRPRNAREIRYRKGPGR
jgi:hypothetical protein